MFCFLLFFLSICRYIDSQNVKFYRKNKTTFKPGNDIQNLIKKKKENKDMSHDQDRVYILPLNPQGQQMEVPVLPTASSDFDVAVVAGMAERMRTGNARIHFLTSMAYR